MTKKYTKVLYQTLWKSPRGPEICEITNETSVEEIMQQWETETSHICQYLHWVLVSKSKGSLKNPHKIKHKNPPQAKQGLKS